MRRELSLVGVSLVAYACALVLGSLIICVGAYASDVEGEWPTPSLLLSIANMPVQLFDLGQKSVEVGPAIESTVSYDGPDPLRVANVGERISIQQDEVCELAYLDRSQRVSMTQHARGVDGGRSESLQRSKPALNQQLQLLVKTDPRYQRRYSDVGPSQQQDASLVQQTSIFRVERDERLQN